jgi:hypothetical protein
MDKNPARENPISVQISVHRGSSLDFFSKRFIFLLIVAGSKIALGLEADAARKLSRHAISG